MSGSLQYSFAGRLESSRLVSELEIDLANQVPSVSMWHCRSWKFNAFLAYSRKLYTFRFVLMAHSIRSRVQISIIVSNYVSKINIIHLTTTFYEVEKCNDIELTVNLVMVYTIQMRSVQYINFY